MNGPSIRRRLVGTEHPAVPGTTNSGTIRTCRSAVRSIPPSRAPPSAACGSVSSTSCSTTRRCWRGFASPTGPRTTKPISSCCLQGSASSCSRSRVAASGWRTGNGASPVADPRSPSTRSGRPGRRGTRCVPMWRATPGGPAAIVGCGGRTESCCHTPRSAPTSPCRIARAGWSSTEPRWIRSATGLGRSSRDQDNDLRALTTVDVDLILDILAGRGRAQRDLLAEAQDRDEGVRRLTEDQALILGAVQLLNRVEIRGGAGSGKTWLALEQARRMAASGRRVALLCYSRGLAEFLRREVAALAGRGTTGLRR